MNLTKFALEFNRLKELINANDHFSKTLTQFFLIQRAFHKLERHYQLNYREFLDTFAVIATELNLCGMSDKEVTNEDRIPEGEPVYDGNTAKSFSSSANSTLAAVFTTDNDNEIELKVDVKEAQKVLEEFRTRFFSKMKRSVCLSPYSLRRLNL